MAEVLYRFSEKEVSQIKDHAFKNNITYEGALSLALEACLNNGEKDQISHEEIISENEVIVLLVSIPKDF